MYLVVNYNFFRIFPGGSDGKESACNVGHPGSTPELGRSLGREHGNPLQYACLENPHGQRRLAGYSPWGCKELDTAEQLITQHSNESVVALLNHRNTTE